MALMTGTMILKNVMNYWPNTASHSISEASLATLLQEPKFSVLTTAIHHAYVGPEFVVQPAWYTHS